MNVENNQLGRKLLSMGYELKITQTILSYVKNFGIYDDDELLVVVDVENGGYFVNKK